jgi:3-hydroxyacyl-[acyl-carrier-protein] dehydratase
MTIATSHPSSGLGRTDPHPGKEPIRPGPRPLFDLSKVDLTQRQYSRADIEKLNPHRGAMSLLDWVIWTSPDYKQAVALKQIRSDEFWVPGHFPAKAMMPGVLMIEAAAQLACFSYNIRRPDPKVVAFLRIEDCSFRNSVHPGDDLYLLCREVKFGTRRFVSDVQGIVGDRVCFDARIAGMQL